MCTILGCSKTFRDTWYSGINVPQVYMYDRIIIYYVHMYNPKIFEGGVGHLFHY